jgi:uncharacterized phosphosugar-binding protein
MSAERFFDACDAILRRIRETQRESIAAAASRIAGAMAAGGALHFYDNGHCPGEPIGRAGGLMAIHPISFSVSVSHPRPPQHPEPDKADDAEALRRQEENGRIAIERSHLGRGDCIIIMSVSGKNPVPVEMALRASERGAAVIAITSLAYSRAVESRHSSGKRLFEVADVVIDNCGVPGDAILDIAGIEARAAPSSGIAGCYIVWALVSEVAARLVERGLTPSIYRSVNLPGGSEYNERVKKAYQETGI